ncbi:MAG: hypothetical protein NC114_10845 [Ruminococcus flavefaciens]|nr:hypothetical protein [Ruminococcus flavefaciens]
MKYGHREIVIDDGLAMQKVVIAASGIERTIWIGASVDIAENTAAILKKHGRKAGLAEELPAGMNGEAMATVAEIFQLASVVNRSDEFHYRISRRFGMSPTDRANRDFDFL